MPAISAAHSVSAVATPLLPVKSESQSTPSVPKESQANYLERKKRDASQKAPLMVTPEGQAAFDSYIDFLAKAQSNGKFPLVATEASIDNHEGFFNGTVAISGDSYNPNDGTTHNVLQLNPNIQYDVRNAASGLKPPSNNVVGAAALGVVVAKAINLI